MNPRILVLPALCLGGTALLFAPARNSFAFNKLGGSLGEAQRDFRVFDNFLDATADDNAAAAANLPGWTGLDLAVWKGTIEWGNLHGDGSGDPLSGNLLGSGGANFDAFWSGSTSGVGTTNNNIVSSLADCGGGGTLAFTETPISDGWRIRFCDEWTWDDGPGTISNRWDIQGVMCHEYGHALGLDHTTVNGATMFPSGSPGQTSIRSIANDDALGVQCIYGVASGTKPTIVATVASAGTLTIYGSNYDAGATNEVWFTNSAVTATGVDPIVRVTNVASSIGGTVISVTIPVGANAGDVMVNKSGSGGATLSNAFPTDLVGTFGVPPVPHPNITNVSPSNIDALIPGTAETITVTGTDLNLVTSLLLDGNPIPLANYTIVNPTTITLDMPQANTLGTINLGASDGVATDNFPVTIVAPATPKLQLGTGDAGNVVSRAAGLDVIVSANPGARIVFLWSPVATPPVPGAGPIPIELVPLHLTSVVSPTGWTQFTLPGANLPPDPTLFGTSFHLSFPRPFPTSNNQSVTLVP